MFNCTINYETRRASKLPMSPSGCPHNEDTSIKSGLDSDEVGVISYSSVHEVVDSYLKTIKIPEDL